MAKKKDSFIAYYEWEDAFADFTNEQFGELFRAIYAYEKRGEAYTGSDPAIKIAMRLIMGMLDRNREKYEAVCERNRKNGAKGGAPKGNQNAKKNNPKQPSGGQNNPNNPKQPDHDHEHEHDNEHDHENDHEHDAASGAVLFFQREFSSSCSSDLEKEIREACNEAGEEMVMEAMRTAIRSGKRSWGYCKGILNNWQRQGGPHPKPKNALVPDPDPQPAGLSRETWLNTLAVAKEAFGEESPEYQDYYEMGRKQGWTDA